MFPCENLEVYKKSHAVNQAICRLLTGNRNIPACPRDQRGRASLSIMLNTAEGRARFSNRDRRNFYLTARGSAFECACLCTFRHQEGEISQDYFADIGPAFKERSRTLNTMIKSLEETTNRIQAFLKQVSALTTLSHYM